MFRLDIVFVTGIKAAYLLLGKRIFWIKLENFKMYIFIKKKHEKVFTMTNNTEKTID